MKKSIFAILLLLFFSKIHAQTNEINITDWCSNQTSETDGSLYLKDISNLYIPYIGIWKWTDGSKEFVITLIKQTKFHYNQGNDDFYRDRIVGYYVYMHDELDIINTTSDNLNDDYGVKVSFSLDCYSQLSGTIYDVPKNKTYSAWFEIISPTQIRLKCKEREYHRPVKEGMPAPAPVYVGNTFPLDMVLTKQ